MAVYKHDREVKLGSTEEQLQLTNQTDLRIPRLGFLPLGHIPPPPPPLGFAANQKERLFIASGRLLSDNMILLVMTSS